MKGKTPKKRPLPVDFELTEQAETISDAPPASASQESGVESGPKSPTIPGEQARENEEHGTETESAQETEMKKMKIAEQLTLEQERDLAEWFSEHPLFYDQSMKEFKMRNKRDRLLEAKGKEMGITGTQIWTWFKSMRTVFGKLKKKKSGQAATKLTARQKWTMDAFSFLDSHLTIRSETRRLGKLPEVMTEDGQGREEPAESESAEVESTQSLEGSSQQSKRPKAKRIDEAILKIADKMCANEHLKEQLDAAMKAGNNERTMFCQWMGMEASKLSEELWMSFMSESFNLIMRYRQQQLMQQQPQVPQVRPTSSAQTSTPVHHQSQGWQPPQLWSGNQPPFFDTSLRSLNASGLTGLDEQNAQPNTPEPVRSTLRTGELVARALQGLGD